MESRISGLQDDFKTEADDALQPIDEILIDLLVRYHARYLDIRMVLMESPAEAV